MSKLQMLFATQDTDYIYYISKVIAEKYADIINMNVCTDTISLREMITRSRYDVVLFDYTTAEVVQNTEGLHLVYLWADEDQLPVEIGTVSRIKKYQRISSIINSVLQICAVYKKRSKEEYGTLTVVWSPAGGVGKTTVALAYAARQAIDKKSVAYFGLESFSSLPQCFADDGESISKVFANLDKNPELQLRAMRLKDPETGLYYYKWPDNYEDISILTLEDVETLINALRVGVDELVLDMPAVFDARTRKMMEQADKILVVTDTSKTAAIKLGMFVSQSNIYRMVGEKMVQICNKGATAENAISARNIKLPLLNTGNMSSVYKTLSGSSFQA